MASHAKEILIVDDHPIVINGLQHALDNFKYPLRFDIKQSIKDAKQSLARGKRYDLIVTDLYLPNECGFEFLAYLAQRHSKFNVVVFSSTEESADIRKAIQLGAVSVISKSLSADQLKRAIATILDGEIYNSSWLIDKLSAPGINQKIASMSLSPRQIEVLGLIDQGYTNKQIAKQVNLSDSTVKYHVKTLFLALDANTRTACVKKARKEGLLT